MIRRKTGDVLAPLITILRPLAQQVSTKLALAPPRPGTLYRC